MRCNRFPTGAILAAQRLARRSGRSAALQSNDCIREVRIPHRSPGHVRLPLSFPGDRFPYRLDHADTILPLSYRT